MTKVQKVESLQYLGGGQWLTLTPLTYRNVTVPSGYITDLASVPRAVWPLIAPFELSILAPVIHDYLYEMKIGTRAAADALFYDCMIDEGVSRVKAWAAYLAVRSFGWTVRRF